MTPKGRRTVSLGTSKKEKTNAPIRESSPTSMLTPARIGLSLEYEKETFDSCSSGGEILSVSTNLQKAQNRH